MTHRFADADRELSEHFTSALGVRAQGYEPAPQSGFDVNEAHLAAREVRHRRELERFGAVEATLARIDPESRRVLRLIYTPHGAPGYLGFALATRWGGGTFVALAAEMPRAAKAWAKATPRAATLAQFLVDEAGRGDATKSFFARLVDDCEQPRVRALQAYEEVRRERLVLERARRVELAQRRADDLAELAGRRLRKERERFDARLRSAS